MELQQRANDSRESHSNGDGGSLPITQNEAGAFVFRGLQAAESPAVAVHFKEAISPSAGIVQ